jgi:glycosyltransferase involved in cell wall biosynthesis
MPAMGEWTELIFVGGHFKDDTWDRIKRVKEQFLDHEITIHQQTGKGKGDAVREGFELAKGEIFMILDADLSMPPEDLPKIHKAVERTVIFAARKLKFV